MRALTISTTLAVMATFAIISYNALAIVLDVISLSTNHFNNTQYFSKTQCIESLCVVIIGCTGLIINIIFTYYVCPIYAKYTKCTRNTICFKINIIIIVSGTIPFFICFLAIVFGIPIGAFMRFISCVNFNSTLGLLSFGVEVVYVAGSFLIFILGCVMCCTLPRLSSCLSRCINSSKVDFGHN
jgi:hypothetical protein